MVRLVTDVSNVTFLVVLHPEAEEAMSLKNVIFGYSKTG